MLCNIMLVSAIQQHESAIGMHMPLLLEPPIPSHPTWLSQSTGFEFPALHSKFPLAIYSTYGNVYVSMLLFQLVPPSPSTTVSTSLFFMSISPLLPYK